MKEVKRFKCDFCTKLTAKKETIERHEKRCKHNPSCFNCYMCKKAYQGESHDGWSSNSIVLCEFTEEEIDENIAEKCSEYDRDTLMYDERSFKR